MPDALDTDKPERKAMSQESEVTKLEPCPFRTENDDGEPHVVFIEWNRASVPHYWAECQTCDAHGPLERTREAAIASWNRRAPPADARLREAERAGLDAALLDAWRDTAIEECAQIVEHVAHNLPIGWGSASGGVVAQEAAARIRALRSSPAPLSPSKGARETPTVYSDREGCIQIGSCVISWDSSADPAAICMSIMRGGVMHVLRTHTAPTFEDAWRTLAKSAAPERPAMAVEAALPIDHQAAREVAEQVVERLWVRFVSIDGIPDELGGTGDAMKDILAEEIAAHFTPAAASPTVKMRPCVQWFAERMEEQLRANDHKPGWQNDDFDALFQRLLEEVGELQESGSSRVIVEAADVANFAMMIADNENRARLNPPASPSCAKGEIDG